MTEQKTDWTGVVEVYQTALSELVQGQIFGVDFVRADGSVRKMAAKLLNMGEIAARSGNVLVLDMVATAKTGEQQIRSFKLARVLRLRVAGQEI